MLESSFKAEEIGHICCLGRCHEGGAFQYRGKNYRRQVRRPRSQKLFKTGEGDDTDRYVVVVGTQPEPILTAEFPGHRDILRAVSEH